jgi:hypothetical protein
VSSFKFEKENPPLGVGKYLEDEWLSAIFFETRHKNVIQPYRKSKLIKKIYILAFDLELSE